MRRKGDCARSFGLRRGQESQGSQAAHSGRQLLMAVLTSIAIRIAYRKLISAAALVLVNIMYLFQCAFILFIKLRGERTPTVCCS